MNTNIPQRDPSACTFNWENLTGKVLSIRVGTSYDSLYKEKHICVIGYEENSGKYYVLHQEIKRGECYERSNIY